MNKYVFTTLLGVFLTVTIATAIVPVSIRMRGLGPGLVGIVDDEYSDLFFNPAYISTIECNRVYTNLSNIHYYGEDGFFDPDYSPGVYYNLLGGLTGDKDKMKFGAIIENGGWDVRYLEDEYNIEIDEDGKYIDTTMNRAVDERTDATFGLICGKPISNFRFGLMIAPQYIDNQYGEDNTDISYEYDTANTMIEYSYEFENMLYREHVLALPFIAGIILGEPANEISASFIFGYDKATGIIPTNFITSEMTHAISQILQSREEDFEKFEEKINNKGYYVALNGRNKRRFEDHSISFLAGLCYSNEPLNVSLVDSSYEVSSPSAGLIEELSAVTRQEGSGALNYFALGLGVGGEKYFDLLGTKNIMAIGLLPSFFMGTSKTTLDPEITFTKYYRNHPDTFEYTEAENKGETYEFKETFNGLIVSIPVGLETYLTKNLCFRLGASEDIMLKIKEKYEETLTDEGWMVDYSGTDTSYIQHEDANELDSYYSKDEVSVHFSNETNYYYGFGYKVNDNIEFNFLNTSSLIDLRSWALGVNIKF